MQLKGDGYTNLLLALLNLLLILSGGMILGLCTGYAFETKVSGKINTCDFFHSVRDSSGGA